MSDKTRKKQILIQKKQEQTSIIKNKNNSSVQIKSDLFAYLIIIIFGFILYANTITHDYALDDAIVITKNQFTQQGIKGIPDIFKYETFTGFWLTSNPDKTAKQIQEEKRLVAGGRYRPLSLVTFAVEIELFGNEIYDHNNQYLYIGSPIVSHFNNIILYIFTSIILFIILKRLLPENKNSKWYFSLSFIVSLLFLAHPIHTEAVANIKGRDEIMTLLGSLLALWFTIKYLDTNKIYNLVLSSFFLFIGLLSKENAITFLAIIPLSVYYFTNHSLKKIFISLLPLLFVSGIFLIIRGNILNVGIDKGIPNEIMNNPFLHANDSEKYATIFYTLWMYVRLLFYPHPLTYDYYPFQIEIIDWGHPGAFLSLIFYLAIGFYAIYGLLKKKDIISYSIWFYLIPLSVVSNIFFPVGTFMNERFAFISSIGFCILFGYLIYNYIPKIIKNTKSANNLMMIIILIILSLYSIKTISRNKAWKNDYVLFTTDVKTSYNSAKSTCSAGGKILEEVQKPYIRDNPTLRDEYCLQAIKYLERSLEIYPQYVDALILMGNAHYRCYKDIANSLKYYNKIFEISPRHNLANNNSRYVIGSAFSLLNSGESVASYDEILEVLLELLKIKPDHLEANHLAGTIYGRYKNNLEKAVKYFENAEKLNLKTATFYRDFAVTHGLLKNYEEALKYFLKALEQDPNDIQTYWNTAATYSNLGNQEKSQEYFNIYNEMIKDK